MDERTGSAAGQSPAQDAKQKPGIQVTYLSPDQIRPYKGNPRKNKNAVDAVAASIKEYGFNSPIILDKDNIIINGHTRYLAAKKLGLAEVPVVWKKDLTEEQVKEYRLIDNKTSEYATWDKDKLADELINLDFGSLDFAFDFSRDAKKSKKWEASKKLCDLKDNLNIRKGDGFMYSALFRAGDKGRPLKELKTPENVWLFASTAIDYIKNTMGTLSNENGWCIATTPRRRHVEGFHFATAVCEEMASQLGIPFYSDICRADNKDRLHPVFTMLRYPEEPNVILYDDILTTGVTLKNTRDPLVDAGYTVFTLISIDNH